MQTAATVLLCATLIGLALFVVFHNPRAALNRRFGLCALAISGWILSVSLALSGDDPALMVLLGRVTFAFASAIPFTLFWMFDAFSNLRGFARKRVLVPAILCATFIALSLSPWLVRTAVPGYPRPTLVYGPAHRPFGVYFLLCFAFALYTLWQTLRSASGLRRLQLRYLLLGVFLGGAGAMITNLIIPLTTGTSTYSALGPYFSLLVIAFSAHAIIRYRLMDIKVIIRKGVVYVCAIIAAGSLFLLLVEAAKRLSGYDKDTIPILGALGMSLTLALLFQPLKKWIQLSFNRYLYRQTYDYQRTIREASRRLSTMLDLDPLLDYLIGVIETTFNVETIAVYLRDPVSQNLTFRTPSLTTQWPYPRSAVAAIDAPSLVAYLSRDQKPLVREEPTLDEQRMTSARELQHLGGDIAFPLIDDKTLAGLIVVGPKRSGDPYFAEDIDLLETLISQAAVAMKNASLYRQVVLVNEYVDNILSTMDSGVVAVSAGGEISLFNHAAERLTGLLASTVYHQPYECLPDALNSPLSDTLHGHVPRSQFEISLKHPAGTAVPLVCSTAILQHREGPTHGALIVFSDVTRLKDLEREQRRAARLASFGALASGVAHEIKNPLVAIRTFAELLTERFTDPDFREDFAKVVIREISRIDDLVDRLRGIAATAPQQVGTTDIREPIRDTLTLLRAQLEQTRTTVYCDFEDSTPFVAVAEVQLKQLFLNLLLNSIEAMGSGGQITIRVRGRELRGSQWIVAEITDTGPGIPESVRTSIFDPFFTTKPRGSGLGLAICRGITDAHRGAIRAENRTDRSGASIVIEFPLSTQSPLIEEQQALHI